MRAGLDMIGQNDVRKESEIWMYVCMYACGLRGKPIEKAHGVIKWLS
jgi:hypothetical protein